jgi:CheY-like chemotaxis protein
LLAFGRRQRLEMKLVDLNNIVAAFEKMIQRIIGEDVEVATVLDPNLANIKGDPSQIQQALMNLSINARDAMPHGGRLSLETANVVLDQAYAKERPGVEPGPHVMLAVSDNGIGMNKETVAKLFEPFFTTKPAGKGTGLGLATVYGIAKQHGGTISVYSEPGHGTTFKIFFPQATDAAQPEKPAETKPRAATGKGAILVVEDDIAVRKLACSILQGHGYTVLEASSSHNALHLAETHDDPIDLLLTDVVMPRVNGKELYRRIAAVRPGIKVLYMSGYTADVIAHHGVLEAEIEFLPKPFTVEGLIGKIAAMLASKST